MLGPNDVTPKDGTPHQPSLIVGKIQERGMVTAAVGQSPQPAESGSAFRPPWWVPLVVVVLGGGLSSAIPFVTGPALVAVTVALGVVGSVAAALGIRSAGTK